MTPDVHGTSDQPPSDCNIRMHVESRLHRSRYKALCRVWCEFQPETGVLHLRGSLPSYYLKQVAQALVLDLEGVNVLDNQITVDRRSWSRASGKADGAGHEEPDASRH
jgi:osmotically-inducible protein OsmY